MCSSTMRLYSSCGLHGDDTEHYSLLSICSLKSELQRRITHFLSLTVPSMFCPDVHTLRWLHEFLYRWSPPPPPPSVYTVLIVCCLRYSTFVKTIMCTLSLLMYLFLPRTIWICGIKFSQRYYSELP